MRVAAGRDVRVRDLGCAPPVVAARSRPARRQAAALRAAASGSRVRLGGARDPAHPALHPELDEDAFYDYLTFAFAPPPQTLFNGIHKLAAAEYMIVGGDGQIQRERYWSPWSDEVAAAVRGMEEAEMVSRTRELLADSIEKRMMSDVPFGVFLSGGVDSSTNVALMAERSSKPIRTFSTAPKGHPRYDELSYARMVVQRFSTDHHEVVIDDDDLAAYIPELIEHQDEPTSDWTAIPQHFVTKLARDTGTPVVQVGEGADEIFHGYKGYADHRRFVVPFQRRVPRLGATADRRRGRVADAAAGPRHPAWRGHLRCRGLADPVLGRGALLPRTAQGAASCATQSAALIRGGYRKRYGARPRLSARMRTSFRR